MRVLFFQRVPAIFRKEFFEQLNTQVDVFLATGEPNANESMKCFKEVSIKKHLKSEVKYFLGNRISYDKNWKVILKDSAPDVVVITPTPRMLSNYLLIKCCRMKGIPVIGWGMGEMPNRGVFRRALHRWIQRTLVDQLDGVACYSSTAESYYQSLGVTSLAVVHNSIDTNKAIADLDIVKTYDHKKLSETARALGIKIKKRRLVYLGRIIPSKRLDKLVESLANVENVQLVVVGAGDKDYVESIRRLAQNSNVDILFVGHKSGVELAEVMYLVEMFVLPSLGGLAINHAMSFELPCIVSQGDGTERDLVTDDINGYIFESENFDDLRQVLLKALQKDSFEEMGVASRLVITNKVNIDLMVKAMEKFLRSYSNVRKK
ncbi:glycosyltransferase family 4 protein [Vibrio harveyi]|uniref:glycosyltransferase family 4 protein n=1 Tax=Vibrio harveyi TaxID=669 RepID=UPI002A5C8D95|nr:glycosyltransferase family 4 protein [Vibrio harveyi]